MMRGICRGAIVIASMTLLVSCGSEGDGTKGSASADIAMHGTFSFDLNYSCDAVSLPENLRITFRDGSETVIGTYDFVGKGDLSPSAEGCLYEADYSISLPRTDFYEVTVSPEVPGLVQPPPRSYEELKQGGFEFDITAF